jgi:hypothetical protein
MATKFVKCVDNSGYSGQLTIGKVYEVELDPKMPHMYIIAKGDHGMVRALDHRFLFVAAPTSAPIAVGTKVKCIDTVGAGDCWGKFTLQLNAIYTVEREVGDDYYELAECTKAYGTMSWDKKRFVKADASAPTTVAAKIAAPIAGSDADKTAELNFFKRRANQNECPCGGVRGVCPDHPRIS